MTGNQAPVIWSVAVHVTMSLIVEGQKVNNLCNKSKVKTCMPIKSQIVIMSFREMPPSSDESDTIDVGSDSVQGLFANIKVEPVPVKIVDDLNR